MELEAIMQEAAVELEKSFYGKPFNFSYSSLSKLLWNPAVFYQLYVVGIKEERLDAHLVQGKLIHLLLLEPEKFEQEFMMSPSNLPTGTPRVIVDRVYQHHVEIAQNGDTRTKLEEFGGAIIDVMRDLNYFQALTDDKKTGVTGDQKRLDKVITADTLSYWNFLKVKGNKTLVDEETYKFCKDAVEIIKTNKKVCDLIACNVTEFDSVEVYNELYLECKVEGKPFGLKGIIDNLVIDHDNKTIRINDMKTTAKELKDFPETVEYYNYWLQGIVYMSLVTAKFGHLIEQGYTIDLHFIVIDKMFSTYPFKVKPDTAMDWYNRFLKVLEIANWHYTNNDFQLPYDFATESVTL